MTNLSGVRMGPLAAGERVTLTDPKGRRHSLLLTVGKEFHTTKGAVKHDDLIGGPEGVVVTSTGGMEPSARWSVGEMRTIQPSSSGLGTSGPEKAMLFWPGFTSIGPYW